VSRRPGARHIRDPVALPQDGRRTCIAVTCRRSPPKCALSRTFYLDPTSPHPRPAEKISDGFTSGDNNTMSVRLSFTYPRRGDNYRRSTARSYAYFCLDSRVQPQPIEFPKLFLTSSPLVGVAPLPSPLRSFPWLPARLPRRLRSFRPILHLCKNCRSVE